MLTIMLPFASGVRVTSAIGIASLFTQTCTSVTSSPLNMYLSVEDMPLFQTYTPLTSAGVATTGAAVSPGMENSKSAEAFSSYTTVGLTITVSTSESISFERAGFSGSTGWTLLALFSSGRLPSSSLSSRFTKSSGTIGPLWAWSGVKLPPVETLGVILASAIRLSDDALRSQLRVIPTSSEVL